MIFVQEKDSPDFFHHDFDLIRQFLKTALEISTWIFWAFCFLRSKFIEIEYRTVQILYKY